MKSERTKNTIRNVVWGFLNKIILIIFPFLIRTVIIKILGSEYLGLNSLFSSLLQVLNLTELGFTSAVVYNLYKPIADKDESKICALIKYYKKAYNIIGTIIFIIGIALLPFLKKIISGDIPDNINIYILYLIYLGNTVISYWLFAYKSVLLTAHQRNDITSNINSILSIIQYFIQILLLIIFKNYYLYIIVLPIITIVNNIVIAIITKNKYRKYIPKGRIDFETKKSIKKKVFGLMLTKICQTTRNSFDSIYISMFLGLNIVASYNNYYLIMTSIITFLSTIIHAMQSGVGNSIATEGIDKNYKDMIKFDYMFMWITGFCSICLLCLYQPFMKIWLGTEYMLPFGIVILLIIYFYSLQMGNVKTLYIEAAGLWYESRYRAIIESFLNIFLNYVLGKLWGLYGIVLATIISIVIVNFGFGSQIIFKYYFKNGKLCRYYLSHIKYFIVTLILAIFTLMICNLIEIEGIVGLIIKALICMVIPNIMYIFIYCRTENFKNAKEFIVNIIKRR